MHVDPGCLRMRQPQILDFFGPAKVFPFPRRHDTLHPVKARWVEKRPRARECVTRSSLPNGDIRRTSVLRQRVDTTAPPTRLSQAPGTRLNYGLKTPRHNRPPRPAARIYGTLQRPSGGRIPGPSTGMEVIVRGVRASALCANESRSRERQPPLGPLPTASLSRSFPWCRGVRVASLIGHVRICGSPRGQPLGRPGPFFFPELAEEAASRLPHAHPGGRNDEEPLFRANG